MENRTQESLIALRRILRASDHHAKALSRRTGLTTPQWIVLQILGEVGETTPKEIAARARISQATVTALLDKLQSRGLTQRTRGQTDRRQVWITLTDSGRATMASAPDALQQMFAVKFEALPDWQQAMLVASLEHVASLLNAAEIDAAPLLDSAAIDH
ncbi:MarR family winged helix-turn-helix transcriptional regulator [Pararhizobium haloflavum]|uniref:MarR family winged helix-turn-helix transcriptional regulator n=1 Tax=Pararhizobium haloflavum TaxID=2037914 RepID=UPI000C197693|nr:MarR family transcriptional regulator [Pararhizobium haloflavum]